MKVLTLYQPSAGSFIFSGWANALINSGHEFRWLHKDTESVFDVFNTYEPDLFIGTTYWLDRATIKCIAKRPNLKVIMKGSNWGDLNKDIDLVKYPILMKTDEEVKLVEELFELTGKPQLVFNHYDQVDIPYTMGDWGNIGVKVGSQLPAADIHTYFPTEPDPKLLCDIGFCGGYWPYKAKQMDKHLSQFCLTGEYNVKLFGNQAWPYIQYLGSCPDHVTNALFSSARICPNLSEPHAQDLGFEISERVYKVTAAGGFCCSDNVKSLRETYSEEELILFNSPQELKAIVDHVRSKPVEYFYEYRLRGLKRTLYSETYYHRIASAFQALGLIQEKQEILEKCHERTSELLLLAEKALSVEQLQTS